MGNTNTNVRKLHVSTVTSQHATRDPTTQQQGWPFGLVSPWRQDHTRGSQQDIHSTRVLGSPGRLWMARNRHNAQENHCPTLTRNLLSTDIEAYGHVGSCPGYELLTSQGEATKSCRNEFRERVGTTVERILAGEARRETCKDRVAERKRDREVRRARIELSAGDVPEEPRDKNDEQAGGSTCGRIWRLHHREPTRKEKKRKEKKRKEKKRKEKKRKEKKRKEKKRKKRKEKKRKEKKRKERKEKKRKEKKRKEKKRKEKKRKEKKRKEKKRKEKKRKEKKRKEKKRKEKKRKEKKRKEKKRKEKKRKEKKRKEKKRKEKKRKEKETSESTKEIQKQHMKNKRTNGGRRYDLIKKLRIHQASSDPHDALEHPMGSETPSRLASVLVQKSGHVDDDAQISALDPFYEMDGRTSRYIGKVLDWYRTK